LICSPTGSNKTYLQLLAATARFIKLPDFLDQIISLSKPQDVMEFFQYHSLHDAILDDRYNHLLIITIFRKEKVNDVLTAMVELGIGNASVLRSFSLGKRLCYNFPVFAGLKLRSNSHKTETTIVLATISDKKLPKRLFSLLKESGLDLEKAGNGFMQIFNITQIIGHTDEFI
jgi:hypothetical protein